MSDYMYLSTEHIKLICELHDFPIDIHKLNIAKLLRDIERDQQFFNHSVVVIGRVLGDYGVHDHHPYFSVKLGVDGLNIKDSGGIQ